MKQYTLYIYICSMLCVFAACSEASRMGGIRFNRVGEAVRMSTQEIKEVQEDLLLSADDQVFDVSVELDSMHSDGQTDSLACTLINTYIVSRLLGMPSALSVADAVNGYIAAKKEEFRTEEYIVTCYDHITGTAEYGIEGIINYTYMEDYYGGGAHPTQTVTIKRFNAHTGTPVELWDVFVDSCATSLKNLLTERLMEVKKVSTIEELHSAGYLEMVDMFVPANFRMDRDSISFFFNQYDIAPYALGQTSLSFSYDELKPYMK